jgi:hypothetical protein
VGCGMSDPLPIGTRVRFKDPDEWGTRKVLVVDGHVIVPPDTYGATVAYWLVIEGTRCSFGYPTKDELEVVS